MRWKKSKVADCAYFTWSRAFVGSHQFEVFWYLRVHNTVPSKVKITPLYTLWVFRCSFYKTTLLHCLVSAKEAILPLAFSTDPVWQMQGRLKIEATKPARAPLMLWGCFSFFLFFLPPFLPPSLLSFSLSLSLSLFLSFYEAMKLYWKSKKWTFDRKYTSQRYATYVIVLPTPLCSP